MMSEQLQTQANITFDTTVDTTIQSISMRKEPKPKPRFAEFACSVGEVSSSSHSQYSAISHRSLSGVSLCCTRH
jgi:hypothetical protein